MTDLLMTLALRCEVTISLRAAFAGSPRDCARAFRTLDLSDRANWHTSMRWVIA